MCPELQIIDYQQAYLIDLYIEITSALNLCGVCVCIVYIVFGILYYTLLYICSM